MNDAQEFRRAEKKLIRRYNSSQNVVFCMQVTIIKHLHVLGKINPETLKDNCNFMATEFNSKLILN